ncbi:MAG: 3-phosphoglycerate dehydrogenase [Spirochaetaceae bacterium]|nr:MAG: 3-phosphoglycerate dehydrogenase [Spirochaetaceae bacterium]
MFSVRTYNRIAESGLRILREAGITVDPAVENPDGILVRSASLHEIEFGPQLKAIARAGAGYNNVPVDRCSETGIVVFNTPGANANSVKELVLTGLLLSSRRIVQGINWARSLAGKGDEVPALIEKSKSSFIGPEISGKTLGVIGLGAIGVMVSNAAEALGMRVIGYDPYLSVESAWGLSRTVERSPSIESLFARSDYITLHVPLNGTTRQMLSAEAFGKMKPGVRVLNLARGGLVDDQALLSAVEDGTVECYVTDFPTDELACNEKVLPVPHLGASTPEAEENCALMAARQLRDYLLSGNVVNSVNFPDCEMGPSENERLVIANRNIPNMVGQITTILAEDNQNILDLLNRHKDDLAYNIIDIERALSPEALHRLRAIDGVLMVREVHARPDQ